MKNLYLVLVLLMCSNFLLAQNSQSEMPRDNTRVNINLPLQDFSKVVVRSKSANHIQTLLSKYEVLVQKLNSKNCSEVGNVLYNEFYHLNPDEFIIEDVRKNIAGLLKKSFALTIAYKNKYNSLGNINLDCVDATRRAFLALRSFGDYIGYLGKVNIKTTANQELPAGTIYNLNQNSKIQSGDVIVSRGNAYSSATISRITDTVTQFSHLAIIYIDSVSLEKFVIEAHIEQGTIVTTWEKYINDGKIRALVLRQKDATLAHSSAKAIYNYVKEYKAKNAKNIPYDFGMNKSNPGELYCSEVVQLAYQLGSKGKYIIPQYLSQSNATNVIKDSLGIGNVKEFFSPIDLEMDQRFSIVAEYKNYELINQAWSKDAVLTFLFDLWNKDEINLNSTYASRLLTSAAVKLRKTKLGEKYLLEKVPDNGPYSGVLMMTILNNFLAKDIDQWLDAANSQRSAPMNYTQTLKYLKLHKEEFIQEFAKFFKK